MLHTVVVPLDGSRFAEQALEPAHRVAHRLRAALELVHVFEPTIPSIYASGAPVLDPAFDLDLRIAARTYLETIAEREGAAADIPVTATLLEGPVVKTLAEHVARLDGALVIMTTHGRGGLARAWLGSVTDGLVRSVTAPVLAIRSSKDAPAAEAMGQFGRVLLPLEGLHFGSEIIERAVEIAGTAAVEYVLLHVLSPVPVIAAPEPAIPVAITDLAAERAAANEFLSKLADPLRARGIQVSTKVVIDGHPTHAILEVVETEGIDLIGIATHGFRGAKRLLLGSVADKVLRSAPVPVLLVRPPEASEEKTRTAADSVTAAI